MSGTRVASCAAFSGYRFPLYPPASLAQLGGINIAAGARKLEMKKVRLTATRVSVSHYNRFKLRFAQSRLLRCGGNIVEFAYDAPAYWKRDAPSSSHRGDIHVISLYSKNGCDISLSARERAAIILYSRNVCDVSLYIRYETDTRWDIGEEDENCSKNGYLLYKT